MSNNLLGWIIIVILGGAFMAGVLGVEISEDGYMILGLFMMVFGIWGGIRLIRN